MKNKTKAVVGVGIVALIITVSSLWGDMTNRLNTNVYQVGMMSLEVKAIQQKLSELGYYNGAVDGIYGEKTKVAVTDFQRSKGLVADGVVGEKTLNELKVVMEEPVLSYEDDIMLLARVIYSEARGEPYLGQVAVGAVVLNRINSDEFPNTMYGVVYQPLAFTAVSDGQINLTPNSVAINAAIDAIAGFDPTNDSLYYYNKDTATSKWISNIEVSKNIGSHSFGKKN